MRWLASIAMALMFLAACGPQAPSVEEAEPAASLQPCRPLDSSFNSVDLTSSQVPCDTPPDPTETQLAQFAWQEFVALNWPSSYQPAVPTRGEPDPTRSFEGVEPGDLLVWQTYMHKAEVFPLNPGNYSDYSTFDRPPQYFYHQDSTQIPPCVGGSAPYTGFNNLDESTEIDLCTLFAGSCDRRFIFQAKMNRDDFNYTVQNNLQDATTRASWSQAACNSVPDEAGAVPAKIGTCQQQSGTLVLPCGDNSTTTEGTIEIKATWRKLTVDELNSGRFYSAQVAYYMMENNDPQDLCYVVSADPETYQPPPSGTTEVVGLTGLHIIHKTANFPGFTFSTFEQVDNLEPSDPSEPPLFYYNRDPLPVPQGKIPVVVRPHPISSTTETVNQQVRQALQSAQSIWQYYKLVGVQAVPTDDQSSDNFFLANITTETNATLANFFGALNANGTINPNPTDMANLYVSGDRFVEGGCQGCHGNAQVRGFDTSFLLNDAPFTLDPLTDTQFECQTSAGPRQFFAYQDPPGSVTQDHALDPEPYNKSLQKSDEDQDGNQQCAALQGSSS